MPHIFNIFVETGRAPSLQNVRHRRNVVNTSFRLRKPIAETSVFKKTENYLLKTENYVVFLRLDLNVIVMEVIIEKTKNKKQCISYQPVFSRKQQPSENRMKTMRLRTMAQKLDNAVIDNDITMQEIVDEVNSVRKERYEKRYILLKQK